MKMLLGAFGGIVTFVLVIVMVAAVGGRGAAACAGGGSVNVAAIGLDAVGGAWDAEQLRNAAHVMNAAAAAGLPVRAQQIGVMTAMGESSLRNIAHGDGATNPDGSIADSIGLFQQQSSSGSTADRMDAEISAGLFFKRLVKVEGWEAMEPSEAAHIVQVNQDPDHYTKWWEQAVELVDEVGKKYGAAGTCTAGEAVLPMDQPYAMTDKFGPRSDTGVGASRWHPAVDLARECGAPVRAMLGGKVTRAENAWLSIRHDDGFVISYLHMASSSYKVAMGDTVAPGTVIGVEASEGQSTGCHLDVRVNVTDNTNPEVAALPLAPQAPGYVDPEKFFPLFGLDVCPADWCGRNY